MTTQLPFSILNCFSIAWCVQLERLVYAKDVPLLRELYAPGLLSFRCFLCEKPLFFLGYETIGHRVITGFVEKDPAVYGPHVDEVPMIKHDDCLKALLTTHDVFLYEAFERAFLQVEVHQHKAREGLSALQAAFFHLRSTVFLKDPRNIEACKLSPAELLRQIEISLQDVLSGQDFCTQDLDYLHSAYMTLRDIMKGE